MHIFSKSPTGIISHIPLANIIWRLELAYAGNTMGIGIRYVSPAGKSATSVAMVCGMDCDLEDKSIGGKVVKVGFPKQTLEENITRLQEAFKTLHNAGLKDTQVDDLSSKVSGLVHSYYDIEKAIRTGSSASGKFEHWEWAVNSEMYGWSWPQEKNDDESN